MTEAVKIRRARRSVGEWRSLLSRHQTSGQGIKAFCRGERISEASFYRWRSLLSNGRDVEATVGKDAQSVFVDLGALNSRAPTKPRFDLRLDLGDGLILHLVRS
jgi:hypothetical protein